MTRRHYIPAIIILVALGAYFGWLWGDRSARKAAYSNMPPVRESGYRFTNPLLVCSQDESNSFDKKIADALNAAISAETAAGHINTAAAYFRNFASADWASINENEKFYPASLGKVPLMIAYYSLEEESNTPVLDKNLVYAGEKDANVQQEIPPRNPIKPGRAYSVEQLIKAMVEDSDNNATEMLFGNIDQNFLKDVFADLRVPYLAAGARPEDFMTVQDYAFFFRVLYNGTYISHADSEKALKFLSETNFSQGLKAGVPQDIPVAHKFGLASIAPDGKDITARELHDCGVVYTKNAGPYLLCIMTKSSSSLADAETAIAGISRKVYEAVEAGK